MTEIYHVLHLGALGRTRRERTERLRPKLQENLDVPFEDTTNCDRIALPKAKGMDFFRFGDWKHMPGLPRVGGGIRATECERDMLSDFPSPF